MGRSVCNDESADSSSLSIESPRRRKDRKRRSRDDELTKSSSKTSSKRHRKRDRKRKKEKSSSWSHDGDDSSSSASDEDSYEHYRERKRARKERKRARKHKKEKRKRHYRSDDDSSSASLEKQIPGASPAIPLDRNIVLADALVSLLEEHPALVEDLPIMLIRLAGGTSFDLSQMTDASASRGIAAVFACLEPFGVVKDETTNNGAWMWKKPDSVVGSARPTSELVLIRLVRAMLDQVGLTMEAIQDHERPRIRARIAKEVAAPSTETLESSHRDSIRKQAKVLLNQFQQGETSLAKELAGLCSMILEGESIALDGLADERLRTALETLFVDCGLEKSEMEQDVNDNDDDEEEQEADNLVSTLGYGLPEGRSGDEVRSHLMIVLETCKATSVGSGERSNRRPIKGPMPMPASYTAPVGDNAESSGSDEEGPLIPGAEKRGPSQSKEIVQARAAHRSLELESVKQGLGSAPTLGTQGEVREEWMLVPGKFDLLSAIKSGHSMKSRNFQARSKAGGQSSETKEPVDPAVQAEISAIRQAHEQSRGPSLLEQHRQRKESEAQAAANKKEAWKWDRDKDLDAGRKVDKNALNMLFGSAGTDLKSKFHS